MIFVATNDQYSTFPNNTLRQLFWLSFQTSFGQDTAMQYRDRKSGIMIPQE